MFFSPIRPVKHTHAVSLTTSALFGGTSLATLLLLIARFHYLNTHGIPHRYGRNAWIYWPTQISIALTAVLMMTQAGLFFHEAINGSNSPGTDVPLVAALGTLGMGLAWVRLSLLTDELGRRTSFQTHVDDLDPWISRSIFFFA